MPAARHRSRSPFIAWAVMAMIGTRTEGIRDWGLGIGWRRRSPAF